jgi:hypothetical protein
MLLLRFLGACLPSPACARFQTSDRFDHAGREPCVNITDSVFADLSYQAPPFPFPAEGGGGALYVSSAAAAVYVARATFARCRTLGDSLTGGACYLAARSSVLSCFCCCNCSSDAAGHFLFVPPSANLGETDEGLSSGTVLLAGWASRARPASGAVYVDFTSLPNCSRVNFSRGAAQGDGAAFAAIRDGARRVSLAFLLVLNNTGQSVVYTEWFSSPSVDFAVFLGNAAFDAVLCAHQEGMVVSHSIFTANAGQIAALRLPDWNALFVFSGCAFSGALPGGAVLFVGQNAEHTLAPTYTHSGFDTFWCGVTATPPVTRTAPATATRARTATRSPRATEPRSPAGTESRSPAASESRSPAATESQSPAVTESRSPAATESQSPQSTESESPSATPWPERELSRSSVTERAATAPQTGARVAAAAAAGSAGVVALVVVVVIAGLCFRAAKKATLLSEKGLTEGLESGGTSYTDGPLELTHELTLVFKNPRLEGIESLQRGDMDELL